MSPFEHAVILAAGRGTRMQSITVDTPKPLIASSSGRTMLEMQIHWVSGLAENVHVTVGYQKEKVAGKAVDAGAASIIVVDGVGNAAWVTRSVHGTIDAPMLVVTTDNLMSIDVDALKANYTARGSPPGMLVAVSPGTKVSGDIITSRDGIVTGLSRATGPSDVASGLQILRPAQARKAAPNGTSFTEIWDRMIDRRELHVADVSPSDWIAIDRPEDLHLLETWEVPDHGH